MTQETKKIGVLKNDIREWGWFVGERCGQDIGCETGRKRHGAGGRAAGSAAVVRGGGGSAGPPASVAAVSAVLRGPTAVPDAPEAASPDASEGPTRPP